MFAGQMFGQRLRQDARTTNHAKLSAFYEPGIKNRNRCIYYSILYLLMRILCMENISEGVL
jgi:hypothetical protein